MTSNSSQIIPDEKPSNYITLLSSSFMLFGALLLVITGVLYNSSSFWASLGVNIGTGLMTAGLTALLIEGVSKGAMLRAQQVIIDRALRKIDDDIRGKDGVISTISKEIDAGKDATWLHMRAVLRSIYSDKVRTQVFDAGISAAYPSWAGAIDDKFFTSQKEVVCFLKDGRTLFGTRRELIKTRLKRFDLKTKIYIVHPDLSTSLR